MKTRFTILALVASLAFSASAFVATFKKLPTTKSTTLYVTRANGLVPQAIDVKVNASMLQAPRKAGEALVWDFENADQFAQFTLDDKDGDGFNWGYYNNTGLTTSLMTAHGGEGLISSASYDNDTGVPLSPDNWLISPEVTLGGGLSFYAVGQDATYSAEKFGVYVIIGGVATQVGADETATSEYALYEFDLSAYAGQTGQFAIVHHNVSDMFMLNIDDISFDPSHVVTPDPTLPTSLTADPASTAATIAWVPGDHNGLWDLRYRPYIDPTRLNADFSMNIDNYQSVTSNFMVIDADGDGNNWGVTYADNDEYNIAFYSESWSYNTYTALSPDNWLITPEVGQGTLTFNTWNYASQYPDQIAVYVAPADWESTDDFVEISNGVIIPGGDAEEKSFDLAGKLGDYKGAVVVAFRHYGVSDKYSIFVSDIKVAVPDALEQQDWIVIEGADNPYTIEGLTPATEYEVQVMAYNEEGDKNTDWSESTLFTTDVDFFVVGAFNEWSVADALKLEKNEDGILSATFDVEGEAEALEFKIATPDDEAEEAAQGMKWFGGVDEYENNFFLVSEELLSAPIDLVSPGANFRLAEAGNYTIQLIAINNEGSGAPKKISADDNLQIVVIKNDVTAVADLNADRAASVHYVNLAGQVSATPFSGVNIQVTTMKDGSKKAVKVVK